MTSKSASLVLSLAVAATTIACSESFDAYFANPCEHELQIEVHAKEPNDVDADSAAKTVTIDALDVEFVEDAFSRFANSISLPGGRSPVEVDENVLPHETVVVPADYCEG